MNKSGTMQENAKKMRDEDEKNRVNLVELV